MQVKKIHWLGGCLLAVFAFGQAVSLILPETRAQEAVSNSDPVARDLVARDNVAPRTEGFEGSDQCLLCHRGLVRELNPDAFLLLTEPQVWMTDPHSKAFEFISWDPDPDADVAKETASQRLSREICGKLGIENIRRGRQAQQCLSCHANWIAGMDQPPPFYEKGVACESCHGPSAGWEKEHRQSDLNWRRQSVAYKAGKGMIDVRNPITRAEQCFSCHVGNVEQGKYLTHQMYAAGHPPLPSIEIESFAKQMPRHWRYLDEKVAASRKMASNENQNAPPFKFFDEFVRQNHAYLRADDPADTLSTVARHHHGAAAVVLGGVVALREAVEVTRDLAKPSTNNQANWPEFAAFDCTACHHDLKQPLPDRTYDDGVRPGRPTWHAWPNALIKLAIFHVSDDIPAYQSRLAAFNAKFETIKNNFQAAPFGDPAQLQEQATDLANWLTDELITPVAAKPFDNQAVRYACQRLAGMGSQGNHDFDSARQIAWALRSIYCELDKKPPGDMKVQALFRELASNLRLDLPNGSGEVCETIAKPEVPAGAPRDHPLPLTGSVPAALAAEVQFDSARFKEVMSELKPLLK